MSAEDWLARAVWQPVIFGEPLRRADLLALKPNWAMRSFRLHVLRNQPFEFVASVLKTFLAYAGWEPQISYSEYDDSLSLPSGKAADVILLWMDFDRFQIPADELAEWIGDRIVALRIDAAAPILISDWAAGSEGTKLLNAELRRIADRIPGVYVADQAAIAHELGERYLDRRAAQLAGMNLSDAACLITARQLGLGWLPPLLEPGVKAVVVDFDETLYGGILGEDGPAGITLTDDHLQLQRQLLALRDRGIFLAGVTRNEPGDIDRLFKERSDLAVHREHFSSLVASWDDKGGSLGRVAHELGINPDTFLFIDDNPGDLAAVAAEWPGIRCLHASQPKVTNRALLCYPGLVRLQSTAADQLRLKDQVVAATRNRAQRRAADPSGYMRSLNIELTFTIDAPEQRQRLHELSTKTNQFNSGLLRFSAVDVARYIDDPGQHVVSITLRDRLSDSGLIGAVFTRLEGQRLMVDEVDISCRALGRGLERLMIMEAIRRAIAGNAVTTVTFAFRPGPRNTPARACLEALAGPIGNGSGSVSMAWDASAVQQVLASTPVHVRDSRLAERRR